MSALERRPIIAYDADDGWGVFNGVVYARWVEFEGEPDESEFEVTCPISGDCLHGCNLTHWMALPPPPPKEPT